MYVRRVFVCHAAAAAALSLCLFLAGPVAAQPQQAPAQPPPASMPGHQHPAQPPPPDHSQHQQTEAGIFVPRDGSGTSWLPEDSPMYGVHQTAGAWQVMWHGNAFAQFLHLANNSSYADIVRSAKQEDADGIAVSTYQGGHNQY